MLATEKKFLTFSLGSEDNAVIPLANIAEVLQVSLSEICVVPQMESCVMGIYNWRGEMLWLIDLEKMLGYSSFSYNQTLSKMMAIVIQFEGKSLGLLVRELTDIESLDSAQMKPINEELFSPEINQFLSGYFINSGEDIILNINADAIVKASIWNLHN
ncbi:chemotaxis protein CheW [Calothrix sp. PCC 6303]|uniref:chemotaxis protein CheW n=1 Tax=Calothrix sp. PCC 6303 TaxID=1170562 RepID=UPI0002A05358|nr:chemotaxis protein CheW [Calothrix sp. PCC 6303]AFZ00035.1 CheW protein [Calothrix sp. PCC 6303]